jgi:hypothetical protein
LTTGAAQPGDSNDASLDRRIPLVQFSATPLSECLTFLSESAGVSFQIDWRTLEAAGIDKSTPITLRLRNVSVGKVLDIVLREAGSGSTLTWEYDDGVLVITTQEELDKKLYVEVYDVRDLLFTPLDAGAPPTLDFTLTPVTKGGGGNSGGTLFGGNSSNASNTQTATPDQRGENLVQIIQSTLRPEVWNINGGPASIRYLNGTLIVNAPRSVHELIGIPVRP